MSSNNLDYKKDVFSIQDIFIMMAVEVESDAGSLEQNWYDTHINLKEDVYDTLDESDQDEFDDIIDDARGDTSLFKLYKEYREIVSSNYEPSVDEYSLEMVKVDIEDILGNYFNEYIY